MKLTQGNGKGLALIIGEERRAQSDNTLLLFTVLVESAQVAV